MSASLEDIEKQLFSQLPSVRTISELTELKASFLGKSGKVTELLRSLGQLTPEEKKSRGQQLHALKSKLEEALEFKRHELELAIETQKLQNEKIDVSLPGRRPLPGRKHLLSQVEAKVVDVFKSLGYSVSTGPEVETDFYNFEALNFPDNHPARDMQDTFFVETGNVLRTHTSPVQIRVMEHAMPPLRIVIPGRVYRHDWDATHSPVFHQIEGLCVGPDITFAHLKGTLEAFIAKIFGSQVKTRFRPSFFPFTEPSAEVDVMGPNGWLEILGCGMVDPNVFLSVGDLWEKRGLTSPYNPEHMTGFAFGMGIERIAMLLHGVSDIRMLYENDLRFSEQF